MITDMMKGPISTFAAKHMVSFHVVSQVTLFMREAMLSWVSALEVAMQRWHDQQHERAGGHLLQLSTC